jgi:hypothetical protein
MKRLIALSFLALAAVCAVAQTPAPSTGISFGVTTSAVGINLNNSWHMAADSIETLSVVNSPNLGAFYVEGTQTLSTDQTFQGYFGGLKYIPKLDTFLSKTTLPVNTFQVSFHAAPGIVRNAAGRNALGGRVGASLDYDPSSSGHFAVNVFRADYMNASGFGGSPSGWVVSSGIAVFFGGSK